MNHPNLNPRENGWFTFRWTAREIYIVGGWALPIIAVLLVIAWWRW